MVEGLQEGGRSAVLPGNATVVPAVADDAGGLGAYGNPPLSNAEAWAVFEGYCADKRIALADEPRGVMALWKKLSATETLSPKK